MQKLILIFIMFLSLNSFAQETDYGDGLSYYDRWETGYYNKIPKAGTFTYTGYDDSEGDYVVYFFKSKNGQMISFADVAPTIRKRYDLEGALKKYLYKNFNITWKIGNINTMLLTATLLPNSTKPQPVLQKEITKSQLIGKWILYNSSNTLRPKEYMVFTETEYMEYHNDSQQWSAPYTIKSNVLTTTDAGISATQTYKLILNGNELLMDSGGNKNRYKQVVQ